MATNANFDFSSQVMDRVDDLLRDKQIFSQDFAVAIGVDPSRLSRYRNREGIMSAYILVKMATTLNVRLCTLIDGIDVDGGEKLCQ